MIEKIGGASRDRTDDLIVANDALSQLSYSPVCGMVRIARLFYQRSGIGTNLSALCLKLGQYAILYEDGAGHGPFAKSP